MSWSTTAGRLVQPVALFVAGMVAASAAAAVAAPQAPQATTTQTRVASCAGMNFHPIHSDTQFAWQGRRLYREGTSGDGWFLCDPHLPHRAVVTKVRFTVYDSSGLNELRWCALVRQGLSTAGSSPVAIAEVAATGVDDEPGTVRSPDVTISDPTIDNNAYAYWLQCHITGGDDLIAIIGADVTYRISSANG